MPNYKKIALCMIVKGSDDEAVVLERCLSYTINYVDKAFITITQPNEAVKKVAESYGAEVSHFTWINDFAAARNFNFSQVPKEYEYIFWLDADDVPRGLGALQDIIKEHPADTYSMNYLYAFDEHKQPTVVHMKTRVIKNDGCVTWQGQLHEDFKENRDISAYFIKEIDILHLSNEERFTAAKERNLEVAKGQMDLHPDDPRSYWNVGNSLKALGRHEESIEMFDKFLKTSRSDDEKYIVRLRRAESFWAINKQDEAIDECRYAIGMKPGYPDAYHLMGSLFMNKGLYADAAGMYRAGLTKKPPYYSIIVYNPRDYDWQPLMNLAKAYFQLNLPTLALVCLEGCLKIVPNDERTLGLVEVMKKEADKFDKVEKIIKKLKRYKKKDSIKKILDYVPKDLRSHPGICAIRNQHFIKTESSGKDIAFFCGFTQEEWTPESVKKKGIGGSEEAIINVSERLAKLGWNVTVYNNCGYQDRKFNKVTYLPFWEWNPKDKQDVLVIWRHPKFLDYELNATKVYLDLHDVIKPGELNDARLAKLTKIFVKSNFHRSLFPHVPDEKFVIVPNGIDSKLFSKKIVKDQYLLVNTSSPDRGLNVALDLFKEVKRRVPKAKFKWAYGWNVYDVVYATDKEKMDWKDMIVKKFAEVGAENLGRLNHEDVSYLYLQGAVFAYPSEFAEIDCISLSKAIASGAIPVTTDFAAMGEKSKYGYFIHSEKTKDNWCPPGKFDYSIESQAQKDQWVEAVVKTLEHPPSEDTLKPMREWAQKTFDWDTIVDKWNTELNDRHGN